MHSPDPGWIEVIDWTPLAEGRALLAAWREQHELSEQDLEQVRIDIGQGPEHADQMRVCISEGLARELSQ